MFKWNPLHQEVTCRKEQQQLANGGVVVSSKSSKILDNLHYTREHEWASLEPDGTVKVGITDHAQESLHEVVYVELPKMGSKVKKSDVLGTVESVKAVSEVYSPVSGEVVGVNTSLENSPELVNKDPYGDGWIAVMRPSDFGAEMKMLLSPKDYAALLSE
jgi:glycine cleavage system H protein